MVHVFFDQTCIQLVEFFESDGFEGRTVSLRSVNNDSLLALHFRLVCGNQGLLHSCSKDDILGSGLTFLESIRELIVEFVNLRHQILTI